MGMTSSDKSLEERGLSDEQIAAKDRDERLAFLAKASVAGLFKEIEELSSTILRRPEIVRVEGNWVAAMADMRLSSAEILRGSMASADAGVVDLLISSLLLSRASLHHSMHGEGMDNAELAWALTELKKTLQAAIAGPR